MYQFATVSHLDLSPCRERGNEGITHRPKDESEFVAKKMTFEANIFKFFLKGEPTVPIRRNLTADENTNGYRTDTEQVRECERMGTERIQNGYRTDIERISNGYGTVTKEKAFSVKERVPQNTC